MRAAALLSLASLAVLATPAAGETPSSEALVRALDAQPGVAVTRGGDAGGYSFTEWRRNGVFYRLERQGGKERLIGDDESGAGAVMCSWGIYGLLRDALDDCPADRFSALRGDLDRDIAAMEAFIAANSPTPLTVAELRAEAAKQRARTRAASDEPRACAAGDVGAMVTSLDAMGPEGRRAAVDELLATPRWPVLNPCL